MKAFSLRRTLAIFIKEFQQMMRDRLTFAMAIGVPILQLVLFGYAINTDPKGLPTVLVSTHYMDEAERCHELVYIAYGKTLARGTEREIIDQAGLHVWAVEGDGVATLVEPLKTAPGVMSVAAFGNALHVAGQDDTLLEQAIAPYREREGLHWQRADANLEDVFISLIGQAQDNFAQPSKAAT